MKPDQIQLLHVFDDHVFGIMRADVESAIRANAIKLAALGLVTYTEFLGGLATGELGTDRKSSSNFRAFLPYLGKDYERLDAKRIYERVRCGLVHEFFIKGESRIYANGRAPCGIIESPKSPIYFILPAYRDHLFAGARTLRDELLADDSKRAAALAAVERVGVEF